jgi:hypothetical protein
MKEKEKLVHSSILIVKTKRGYLKRGVKIYTQLNSKIRNLAKLAPRIFIRRSRRKKASPIEH